MLKNKQGTSIISLVLCAIVVAFVTTALVVATNNSAMHKAQEIVNKQEKIIESTAYTKVYTTYEVQNIARHAFVNNYLAYYNNEVDLEGFEALIIGEMMHKITLEQLEDYYIYVTHDGVDVFRK